MTKGDAYAPNILPGKAADSPLLRFVAGLDRRCHDAAARESGFRRAMSACCGLDRARGRLGPTKRPARWPTSWIGGRSSRFVQPPVAEGFPMHRRNPPNPIDAFIEQTLREKNFPVAPEADRRTLIRRVVFRSDRAAADAGRSRGVCQRPRSGWLTSIWSIGCSLRRAMANAGRRHWMDAAHFAETHGHDQDRIREYAWPYRDYLIASFNADKPYGRFVEEQVAGDVLFPDDPQATVALGFLAAGPWDESSLRDIQENTLDRQIARYIDRDDMVSNVMNNFASATVQCARCHDHKFDPISQQDYYALQADFAGVDKATRAYDADAGRRSTAARIGAARKKCLDARRRRDNGAAVVAGSASGSGGVGAQSAVCIECIGPC